MNVNVNLRRKKSEVHFTLGIVRRCDHHIMDFYALGNIFHDRVVKGDLIIKAGKKADLRMRRLEVAMTFIMGREDSMEEEVENMASSSLAPPPLLEEEMVIRI